MVEVIFMCCISFPTLSGIESWDVKVLVIFHYVGFQQRLNITLQTTIMWRIKKYSNKALHLYNSKEVNWREVYSAVVGCFFKTQKCKTAWDLIKNTEKSYPANRVGRGNTGGVWKKWERMKRSTWWQNCDSAREERSSQTSVHRWGETWSYPAGNAGWNGVITTGFQPACLLRLQASIPSDGTPNTQRWMISLAKRIKLFHIS